MGFTVIRSMAKKVIARRLLKFHSDKSYTVVSCLLTNAGKQKITPYHTSGSSTKNFPDCLTLRVKANK